MTEDTNFYYKSNRLQQLRGFCYTVQSGSVSGAAEKMGLQQSAVSMQIKSLERNLEVTLFKRKGPKLLITQEGEQLYKTVLLHIEEIDTLPDRFSKRLIARQSEYLTLAANQVSMQYFLPSLIEHCKKSFPKLEVSITSQNREDGYELLSNDKIQAFIGAIDAIPHEFDFHFIAEKESILIARQNHPLITNDTFKLEDIINYEIIRCSGDFVTVPFFEELISRYNIPSYAVLENGDWESQKEFIAHSNAFTIVSDLCYNPERDTKIGIRSLRHFIPNLRYGIVTKKGRPLSPPLQILIEACKTHTKPSPYGI